MSAFLCSTRHIAHIAHWAAHRGHYAKPQGVALILRRANVAALVARYGTAEGFGPARLVGLTAALKDASEAHQLAPAQDRAAFVLALLDCLEYQCSEGDVMEAHPGAAVLRKLKADAQACARNGKPTPGVWSI